MRRMKKCRCAQRCSTTAALGSLLGIDRFCRLGGVKGHPACCVSALVAVLCLVLCLLAQGCVGLGIERTYTEVIRNPVVSEDGMLLLDSTHGTNPVCTSAWLEEHRGKPRSVRHSGTGNSDEIWAYRDGLLWNGVTLFALIPVPLEVPTGSEGWVYVLRDRRVIHATRKWSHYVGGIAGFNVGPCGLRPFGVYSLNPGSPSF